MNPILAGLRALAGKVFVPMLEGRWKSFERLLLKSRRHQRQLLLAKIRRCQDTAFGRDHRFRDIRSLEDFRRHLPIAGYEYYRPYITRVAAGEVGAMFPARDRILMFTLSSGTTAEPKIIPINSTWMAEYRRGWQLWGIKAFSDHHPLFYARLTGVAGNWDMRRTPSNIPCGMASGLSARMQNFLLKMAYSVPASCFEIEDSAAKYYACLRAALPWRNNGLFATATPATVIQFAELGDRFKEPLIRDIRDGTIDPDMPIPAAVRAEILRRVGRPDPERAKELEAIVRRTGRLHPKDYWREMQLIGCWIGGSVGAQAGRIDDFYGPLPKRDIGLLCSEGRFTIPLEDGTPSGALEIASHYYEFIPEDEIDSDTPTVLESHELIEGRRYYILLTTSCGLYRYNILDMLECTGFIGETPLLKFLNKGQRIADMEGEKVSEHQLVEAMKEATDNLGLRLGGFTAVPIRPAPNGHQAAPHYAILLENENLPGPDVERRLLQEVDNWLIRHNVMYQGKRSDGYIAPPRLVKIPAGSWARYDADEVKRRGTSEDHYKHPCLVLDQRFLERFEILGETSV